MNCPTLLLFLSLFIAVFCNGQSGKPVNQPSPKEIVEIGGPPEISTEFPGGKDSIYRFFGCHMHLPDSVKSVYPHLKAFMELNIDEHGKILKAKVLRNINRVVDDELIRVALLMPAWKPARTRGMSEPSYYNLVIQADFTMTDKK